MFYDTQTHDLAIHYLKDDPKYKEAPVEKQAELADELARIIQQAVDGFMEKQ